MPIPFEGRDAELHELRSAMESAKAGKGSMYFITGPVGIGKTRLMEEVCKVAENEGFVVLFGRCLDEKAVPYLPITEVLEKYAKKAVEESYTPLALSVGGVETPSIEPGMDVVRERTRLLENYLRKFNKISEKGAVLFVLDDLQWADTGTLAFIHYLSRSISEMHMLAITAYTEEYLRTEGSMVFTQTIQNINIERNCSFISLSPLGVNEVSIILGAILGTWKLPAELVNVIYERTGGNPLFVEEIGRAILEQELFDVSRRALKVPVEEIPLPDTVKSIISMRIARFDEETKKVLRGCAILGSVFEYAVLKNMIEMDEEQLLDIIDKLIATGYIEQTSGREEMYKFVHNPVYEVIYTETSAPRRRLMHKKAGMELEKLHGNERKYFSELGRHFLLGGEMQKGIEYCIKAGEYALANYATEECHRNIMDAEQVLAQLKDEKLRKEYALQIYLILGDCYSIRSDYDRAITSYQRAFEVAEDNKTKATIMVKLSYPHMQKGEFDKCLEILENALGMVNPEDYALQSEIHRNIGWIYEKRGEYPKAVEEYCRSVEMAEKSGDEIAMGEAYHRLGTGMWFLGDPKKAQEYLEKGLEIRKKHNLKKGIAGSYNNIAVVLNDIGDVEKSLEYYGIAKKIYEEIGDLSGTGLIYNNVAVIYSLTGDEQEAIEFHKKHLEISKKIGDKSSEMLPLYNIGEIYQDIGDYNTALEYYTKSIQLSRELHEKKSLAWTLSHIATTYAQMGNFEKAMEFIDEAIATAEETRSKEAIAVVSSNMGEILRLSKKFDEAEEYYKKALALYEKIEKIEGKYSIYLHMAKLYIDWQKYDTALKLLQEAKEFYTKIGAKGKLRKVEKELARIEKASIDVE